MQIPEFINNHLLGAIVTIVSSIFVWHWASNRNESFTHMVNPEIFLAQITKLDYFKYSDKKDTSLIYEALNNSLIKNKGLEAAYFEGTIIPMDYRLYPLNENDLTEKGGLSKSLKLIKHTFNKLSIPFLYTNESMKIDGNQIVCRIDVNDKEYIFFAGKDSIKKNGIVLKNLADMLNDQLLINKSNERVFLISKQENGHIIFLTKELQKNIDLVIKNKNIQPLYPTMWAKWNQLI